MIVMSECCFGCYLEVGLDSDFWRAFIVGIWDLLLVLRFCCCLYIGTWAVTF